MSQCIYCISCIFEVFSYIYLKNNECLIFIGLPTQYVVGIVLGFPTEWYSLSTTFCQLTSSKSSLVDVNDPRQQKSCLINASWLGTRYQFQK